MTILFAMLAASSGSLRFWFFAGAAILLWIGWISIKPGIRIYRECRTLADTPIVPIRDLPRGLAHVRGKATGGDPLTSPLTRVPCYFYTVQVDKYVARGRPGQVGSTRGWETVCRSSEERQFYLDDGSGKVLVNPHAAQYEVAQTFRAKYGLATTRRHYVDPSLGVPEPSVQDLQAYLSASAGTRGALASADPSAAPRGFKISLWGTDSYRVMESCLLAERDCIVLGSCTENSSPTSEHNRKVLMKGETEKTFLITSRSERQMESALRRRALTAVIGGVGLMICAVVCALMGGGFFFPL